MFLIILLLTLEYAKQNLGHSFISSSYIDTCPNYCQCYSALDGFHVTCQNAKLSEIPLNLTEFLRTTTHQNLIVDLTSNFLSTIPCYFFQIPTILTLILTENHLESLPSCFSQSSIEHLLLNNNPLRFNSSTILSSSKLLHLDISSNHISSLPRTFLSHLRRLQRLKLDFIEHIFQSNNDQWIRTLTTRNQLTIIICNEHFPLPLCLFDHLFQTKKLLAIELNRNLRCDCSFVFLPNDKIHFQQCQSKQQEGICHLQSSRFEQGQSVNHLQQEKYRQICTKEYQTCRNLSIIPTHRFMSNQYNLSLIKNSSITTSTIVTPTTTTTTSAKKDNLTIGAIISFVLVLLIVTIVCLYVILSGHLFKIKTHRKTTDLMVRKKGPQELSNVHSIQRSDENISIDNMNMNFNPQKTSFRSYHQRTSSCSDEETDLTFYSLNNTNHSSSSYLQTSLTETEVTSTIDSSFSNETVIISNRNKQRIY